MASFKIPTDGPETALGQIARRNRLRYSRTFVARSVAAHPKSSSLLALVEVARDLGLEVTAGRTDEEALQDLDGPAIVHFTGVEGGGFGVLERSTDDGFVVWDSKYGLHTIERQTFLQHWTGVVAVFETGSRKGPRERNYLRNRLTEIVFSGYDPPAFVGNRWATLLRSLLTALVLCGIAISIGSLDAGIRVPAAVLAILTLVGLFVTILTSVSIGAQDSSLSDRICARGKLVDCHSVLSSRFSRVFGIPLSDIGIATFASLVFVMAAGSLAPIETNWAMVAWLYALSVPVSLGLIGAQIAMRQLCTLCLAVHAINLIAAAVAWLWLRPDWTMFELLRGSVFLVLTFVVILFLAIPYFRQHQGMRFLVARQQRIASSPFASLAELLAEEPVGLVAADVAVPLAVGQGRHELVALVHPSCAKCDAMLQQVATLAGSGLLRTFVGLAPRDEEGDPRLCATVMAAGLAHGPGALLSAYGAAKKNLRAMLSEDPIPRLAEELSVPGSDITAHLARGASLGENAVRLVDAHAEGTPALFFDGKLFRGELTHLVWLLEQHPELLEDPAARLHAVPDSLS